MALNGACVGDLLPTLSRDLKPRSHPVAAAPVLRFGAALESHHAAPGGGRATRNFGVAAIIAMVEVVIKAGGHLISAGPGGRSILGYSLRQLLNAVGVPVLLCWEDHFTPGNTVLLVTLLVPTIPWTDGSTATSASDASLVAVTGTTACRSPAWPSSCLVAHLRFGPGDHRHHPTRRHGRITGVSPEGAGCYRLRRRSPERTGLRGKAVTPPDAASGHVRECGARRPFQRRHVRVLPRRSGPALRPGRVSPAQTRLRAGTMGALPPEGSQRMPATARPGRGRCRPQEARAYRNPPPPARIRTLLPPVSATSGSSGEALLRCSNEGRNQHHDTHRHRHRHHPRCPPPRPLGQPARPLRQAVALLLQGPRQSPKRNAVHRPGQPRQFHGRLRQGRLLPRKHRRYTPEDVVFVSAEGSRSSRFNPIGSTPNGAYRNLSLAIAARATFVIDKPHDRNRPYNVGERQIATYLTAHGYQETAPGRFTHDRD